MSTLTAIVGGTVFDCTGSAPLPDGVILIDGDRIAAVSPRTQLELPGGAKRIDARGCTVLPGLVNAHEHLSWDVLGPEAAGDLESQMKSPEGYLALRAARNGASYLSGGVTTVRNLGETRFVDLQYRRAFQEGLVPGPRIIASGPWVVATHGWMAYPGIPTCDGPDEVRKFIRANLSAGVDFIKLFLGGELAGACNTNPHHTYLTREELLTAIDETHAKGKMITAHLMSSESPGFRWAVEAGIDTLEHGIWFKEDDFALMSKKGISLVIAGGRWLDGGFHNATYPDSEEILRCWYQRALQSGVLIAVGVDICGEREAMQREVERLVRFGMSNRDALVAATKNGAIVCGLADEVGTLERGKLADVILVHGDPLRDITVLRNVGLVMKGGRTYFRREAETGDMVGVLSASPA